MSYNAMPAINNATAKQSNNTMRLLIYLPEPLEMRHNLINLKEVFLNKRTTMMPPESLQELQNPQETTTVIP